MNSELELPKGFPSALAARAYRVGHMIWPAWNIADAVDAVSEFRSMSLAVTGGNLIVRTATGTQTHYSTVEGNYAYSFDIESNTGEAWAEYVRRSCDEAHSHLTEFTPYYPIIDPIPHTVGFMLMWDSQNEHAKANTSAA